MLDDNDFMRQFGARRFTIGRHAFPYFKSLTHMTDIDIFECANAFLKKRPRYSCICLVVVL